MRSPSPCRPTLLPSDIWLIIIQFVDEPTVKSLSLVNELLRDVALPVVFNTLNITAPSYTRPPVNHRLYLKLILQRVHGIGSVHRILDAIRRLNLISWDVEFSKDMKNADEFEKMFTYHCKDYTFHDTDTEIIKLVSIVYEAIVQLVSSLPRLYRLDCQGCSITPTLSSSIMGSSTLEFICLKYGPAKLHPNMFPPSLHIFEYRVPHASQDIAALIFSQADRFTSLYLPICLVLSQYIDLPTTNLHKLQKLTVFKHGINVLSIDRKRLYGFLSLIPNLRELRIIDEPLLETSSVFSSQTMLRKLESLTAPSGIANDIILSFGPPLKKIHIFTTAYPSEFPNDFKNISKDVEYVAYDGPLENPEKELTHLARMFPNATSVQITATRQRQATHEEIFDVVLSILPDLPHLKQCGVFDFCNHPTDLDRCQTVGFYCPVGHSDDPKYRAHPTLEDVQILSWYRWIWIPEDGWRACDLHYAPVDLLRTF